MAAHIQRERPLVVDEASLLTPSSATIVKILISTDQKFGSKIGRLKSICSFRRFFRVWRLILHLSGVEVPNLLNSQLFKKM